MRDGEVIENKSSRCDVSGYCLLEHQRRYGNVKKMW